MEGRLATGSAMEGGRGRKIRRRDPVATRRANERQVWEEF
jgi:hypothetical protein